MNANRPEPGTPMVIQWRKWDGSPHWRNEGVYLGSDRWGDWVGQPVGWRNTRPGRDYLARHPSVTLIPAPDASLGFADHAVTVNARHPSGVRVYIDLGWEVRWTGGDGDAAMPALARGVDMDLDVVRCLDGRGTWVDDRDEWAEHLVRYRYPHDVVEHLEARALDLEERVRSERPPFDDATADRWLGRLEELALDRAVGAPGGAAAPRD